MNLKKFLLLAQLSAAQLGASGAPAAELGWQNGGDQIPAATAHGDAAALIAESDEFAALADTAAKLVAVNALLEQALAIGPMWVNNYYMRARVYRVKAGDKDGFVADLTHIAGMDPRDSDAPYPNSVFHIDEAKRMLEHVDDYF